jgi:1-deoxy-D-xylulose-5-phosphate synthase
VVAIYSTFLQRAYDQIVHDVCLQDLPVVFALDRAGLVGEDGPTHHGAFDISYLRHIPDLIIMAPADLSELAAMLVTAVKAGKPAALRYPRGEGINPPAELPQSLPIGKGRLLREGREVALVAVGSMVTSALQTAELLAARGIEAAVFDARFIKPLDRVALLELADACGKLVTLEENSLTGGFGSAILEFFSEAGRATPVLRLGLADEFVEHGDREALLKKLGLDLESLMQQIEAFVRASSPITQARD